MKVTEQEQLTRIKEQMIQIYDGDPWYGRSIKTILESVNAASVFNSPGRDVHSIVELLAHMLAWREFAAQRLKGEVNSPPDQDQTFSWERFSAARECVWPLIQNQFHANQQHLLALLRQQDDSLLERTVAGKPYTFGYLLTGLIQHDVYHLGQIAYIQKLLEETNHDWPARGLLKYSYRIFPFENLALLK